MAKSDFQTQWIIFHLKYEKDKFTEQILKHYELSKQYQEHH